MSDDIYQNPIAIMKSLLVLAASKRGVSEPNPLVAAAVVKEGCLISEGVHDVAGTAHAEVLALDKAGPLAKGATLYVTLEPCTHFGRTPPCVEAIIQSGISRVVYAVDDPNPILRKTPARQILENHGVKVDSGLLSKEAARLNEVYFTNRLQNRPHVTLKAAMSLDNKIATRPNEKTYLSSGKSLQAVHKIRREVSGIVVGVGTVLSDNPSLDVRYDLLTDPYQNPHIIIFDEHLKTPLDARLFDDSFNRTVFIVTSEHHDIHGHPLCKKAELLGVKQTPYGVSWMDSLEALYRLGMTSLLVEGGQHIFTSALQAGIVDKALFFMVPTIVASEEAPSIFTETGAREALSHLTQFSEREYQYLDKDLLVVLRQNLAF
ncbi:bifunctional diaminohydroxyphosphoribosylaminopyrimidine deaminase/5-amino-6-(5-phosphoribosylamino)uracil reductase RibD [Candidatus Marinamargulisbacteria bacterium SCGC AG-439-L15]|nr:bifunctional diaminohydroxyphosphoribosylaminopyrimidine deaminase/5-amino-6-(5-phosphoribosylamino)uracil reductase RibD [Candidatus Marinamargulisbacteria bacterium SCGC AG-439-L15]